MCEKCMGKYPVIFISLKGVEGLNFEEAYGALRRIIRAEVLRLKFLADSERITEDDKRPFERFLKENETKDDVLESLKMLSFLLDRHYNQKAILLIDEYDVPLDKAFKYGYYEKMVSLIHGLFGQALKTNEFLQFAVLTGCLRVSRESIFTGLNNFDVNSIVDVEHDEQFGFTESEVQELLKDYGLEEKNDAIKEWYDGYRFGDADIYCPWDVIKYTKKPLANPQAELEVFWINTSGNDLVKRFIDKADKTTQNEIERLIAGEAIEKKIRLDLTYNELDTSIDNLWSVLFTTGYLTQAGRASGGVYKLVIPNREVGEVFVLQIQEWFRERTLSDSSRINRFCAAFPVGEGYSDIAVSTPERMGIVIGLKYANDGNLEAACGAALRQIEEKKYAVGLQHRGMKKVIRYGIAF